MLLALETQWQDLRYAVRRLAGTPAFTVVAVLSLALGIGANTALFSLMDAMLLRALPVKNPQQLVEFVRAHPDGSMMTNLPYPVYEYFRRDRSVLSDVFAINRAWPVIQAGSISESATVHEVSGSFFPALGVQALRGRTIAPDDDRAGAANHVAVISYAFWSRQFGRDPATLGASVRLSRERFTIVGIMPPEFVGVDRGEVPDLWVPLAVDPDPGQPWVLGRLRPGVSVARARAQLEPLFQQALESLRSDLKDWPEHDRRAFLAQRLLVNRAAEGTSGVRWDYWEYSNTLKILMGLTGMVLLIACANLANLLMARSAARSGEIGIRLALGAGRWRLIRQLTTENLLLSLAGGALGLLVAAWGHSLMVGFLAPNPLSVGLDFQIDYRLLAFGLALSVATGLLFGLMPAIRATRAGISNSIRNAGGQRGALHMPLAKGLMAVQIGLSMVLLIGAGLFARSLRNLGAADLGVARENLLLMDVDAPGKAPETKLQFWMELTRRVSGLPGVRSMALAGDAVFGNGGWNQTVWIERPGRPAQDAQVSNNLVGPGFFATAGIPILTGREFGEQDRQNAPLVALVNRTFAHRFFGNENPIGQHFSNGGRDSNHRYQIVGVVGDAKYGTVREQTRPMVFHPLWQAPAWTSCVLHVRTVSQPTVLVQSIRREIQSIDGDALISEVRALSQVIRSQLREDRMFATLASFFALLALMLGAIGIYGMVAYRVAQRTAEIGIRMALGAQRGDVLWLIMRETLVLLAAGAAIGVPAALVAGRLIKSLLFALDPSDPITFACATAVLFAASALAGFLPARRAASIEIAALWRTL
jgi:predicted permease